MFQNKKMTQSTRIDHPEKVYYDYFLISKSIELVRFPSYFESITDTTESIVYIPYTTELLTHFLFFVNNLPFSARDQQGKAQPAAKINNTTIFINPLVKIAQKPSTIQNKELLGPLYETANYFGIKPLIKLFAFYISDCIYPLTTSLDIALKEFHLNPENITIKPIETHLHLREYGIPEFCVYDYIGLYGQPQIINGKLELSKEGLTSLEGIDLITHSKDVTEIILDKNYLQFDSSASLKSYISSFPNLKKMSFSGNRPSCLPLNSFHDLKHIQFTL